jgi:hypothetical protein
MRCGLAVISMCVCLVSACVTLAPGADKVRITRNAPDVATCVAVGNIKASRDAHGNVDGFNAENEIRNQTVGLSGNTAFVTSPFLTEGVAYRCP